MLCFQHNLRLVVCSGTLLCLLVGQLHALTALKSERLHLLRHASARHRGLYTAVASVAAFWRFIGRGLMTNNRCSSEMLGDRRHQIAVISISLVLKKIETA